MTNSDKCKVCGLIDCDNFPPDFDIWEAYIRIHKIAIEQEGKIEEQETIIGMSDAALESWKKKYFEQSAKAKEQKEEIELLKGLLGQIINICAQVRLVPHNTARDVMKIEEMAKQGLPEPENPSPEGEE